MSVISTAVAFGTSLVVSVVVIRIQQHQVLRQQRQYRHMLIERDRLARSATIWPNCDLACRIDDG